MYKQLGQAADFSVPDGSVSAIRRQIAVPFLPHFQEETSVNCFSESYFPNRNTALLLRFLLSSCMGSGCQQCHQNSKLPEGKPWHNSYYCLTLASDTTTVTVQDENTSHRGSQVAIDAISLQGYALKNWSLSRLLLQLNTAWDRTRGTRHQTACLWKGNAVPWSHSTRGVTEGKQPHTALPYAWLRLTGRSMARFFKWIEQISTNPQSSTSSQPSAVLTKLGLFRRGFICPTAKTNCFPREIEISKGSLNKTAFLSPALVRVISQVHTSWVFHHGHIQLLSVQRHKSPRI